MTLQLFSALATSLFCFASFTWALYRHFHVQTNMPLSMRALSLFSLLAYVVFMANSLRGHVHLWQVIGASLLFVASALIFWAAIVASRKTGLHVAHSDFVSRQVATSGPYKLFRHPFYVSYRIFWTATALIGGPLSWTFALAFFLWYAILAHQEEKDLLSSELGSSYAAYLSESGLLRLGGSRYATTGTQKPIYSSLLARAMASLRTR